MVLQMFIVFVMMQYTITALHISSFWKNERPLLTISSENDTETPFMNDTKTSFMKDTEKHLMSSTQPTETSIDSVGGFTVVDPSDPKIQAMADRAMIVINQQPNYYFEMEKLDVLSAKRQIVSGVNTIIEILVASSTHAKAGIQNYPINPDTHKKIYTVGVWDEAWKKSEEIIVLGERKA